MHYSILYRQEAGVISYLYAIINMYAEIQHTLNEISKCYLTVTVDTLCFGMHTVYSLLWIFLCRRTMMPSLILWPTAVKSHQRINCVLIETGVQGDARTQRTAGEQREKLGHISSAPSIDVEKKGLQKSIITQSHDQQVLDITALLCLNYRTNTRLSRVRWMKSIEVTSDLHVFLKGF